MKRFTIILSVAVLSFTACSYSQSFTGNGKVVEEERPVSNFSKISVKDGIDLVITQGENVKLIVNTDENLQNAIKTEIAEGVLNIYCVGNIQLISKLIVYITIKEIDAINADEGSDVITEDVLNLGNLEVNFKDGCDLIMKINSNKLTCNFNQGSDANITGIVSLLSLHAGEGSDIIAKVTSNEITCNAEEGSDIKLTGTTKTIAITASEGSDINAMGLKAENCEIHISEGSDAEVFATNKLMIVAKDECDVIYGGNPKIKNINACEGCDIAEK